MPKINQSYILRFVWDAEIDGWIIQLNHVDSDDTRLFMNLEEMFFHLEGQMYQ